MKISHILVAAVIAATTTAQAATAEHKLPAPLPAFETPEQLAVWRKEMMTKAAAEDDLAAKKTTKESTVFYTGKPYIAETGSYAFRFRQYNPELSRWTTVDPSGFPDGANNRIYAPTPTMAIDFQGFSEIRFGVATGTTVNEISWKERYGREGENIAVPPQTTLSWFPTGARSEIEKR